MHNPEKLIFINQSVGYLNIDIINSFAKDFTCELVTGKVHPLSTPLDRSVKVKRFVTYNRSTSVKRVVTWLLFTLQTFFYLLLHPRTTKLFIVTNPPFAPIVGWAYSIVRQQKFYLLIYDVYPDALTQMGVVNKKSLINKIWASLNKRVFKRASVIFTLSEGMARLVKSYARLDNLYIIPNWTDNKFIQPLAKEENPFARQRQLQNKFTVMYSGNMGATHAVEKIASLAASLKYDDGFHFIAIGEGAKKGLLTEAKQNLGLDNFTLLTYQPPEVLPYSLAVADVGIVTLSQGAEDLSVPSKTYNLLAAGCVLLVIASPIAELSYLVKSQDCGASFEATEDDKMKDWLLFLKANPNEVERLKKNARKASNLFTSSNAELYKKIILEYDNV